MDNVDSAPSYIPGNPSIELWVEETRGERRAATTRKLSERVNELCNPRVERVVYTEIVQPLRDFRFPLIATPSRIDIYLVIAPQTPRDLGRPDRYGSLGRAVNDAGPGLMDKGDLHPITSRSWASARSRRVPSCTAIRRFRSDCRFRGRICSSSRAPRPVPSHAPERRGRCRPGC